MSTPPTHRASKKLPAPPKRIAAYRHSVPAAQRGTSQLPAAVVATGRAHALAEANPTESGNWYVYVADAGRVGLLAGPFPVHQAAIDAAPTVRALAEEADSFAVFYEFGTVVMAESYTTPGLLNAQFNDRQGAHLPTRAA